MSPFLEMNTNWWHGTAQHCAAAAWTYNLTSTSITPYFIKQLLRFWFSRCLLALCIYCIKIWLHSPVLFWPSNKTSREDDMKLGMWQTFLGIWCTWPSETMSLRDHSVLWKVLWLLHPCEISKLLHRAMKAETKNHFIPQKFWVGFPLSLLWNIFSGHSESWVLLKCLLEAKWMVVAICSGFVSEAFQQTVSV